MDEPRPRPHRASAITWLLGAAAAAVVLLSALLLWPAWRQHLAVRGLVEAVRAKKTETPLPGGTIQTDLSPITAALERVEEARAWPAAAAAIGGLLDDGEHEVRWQAAYALGEIGLKAEEVTLPLLIRALESEEGLVRSNAAMGLGEMGPAARGAVPGLIDVLRNP